MSTPKIDPAFAAEQWPFICTCYSLQKTELQRGLYYAFVDDGFVVLPGFATAFAAFENCKATQGVISCDVGLTADRLGETAYTVCAAHEWLAYVATLGVPLSDWGYWATRPAAAPRDYGPAITPEQARRELGMHWATE